MGHIATYDTPKKPVLESIEKSLFFRKMIVTLTKNVTSQYDVVNNIAPLSDGKFDFIHIILQVDTKDDKEDIIRKSEHELMHAYEDYCRQCNNATPLSDLYDEKYKYAQRNLNSSDIAKQIGSALYNLLNKQEVNANTAEVQSCLSALDGKKYSSLADGAKIVRSGKTYQNKFGIIAMMLDVVEKNRSILQHPVAEELRRLGVDNSKKDGVLFVKVKKKYEIIMHKFNTVMFKMIYDYLVKNDLIDKESQRKLIKWDKSDRL